MLSNISQIFSPPNIAWQLWQAKQLDPSSSTGLFDSYIEVTLNFHNFFSQIFSEILFNFFQILNWIEVTLAVARTTWYVANGICGYAPTYHHCCIVNKGRLMPSNISKGHCYLYEYIFLGSLFVCCLSFMCLWVVRL